MSGQSYPMLDRPVRNPVKKKTFEQRMEERKQQLKKEKHGNIYNI